MFYPPGVSFSVLCFSEPFRPDSGVNERALNYGKVAAVVSEVKNRGPRGLSALSDNFAKLTGDKNSSGVGVYSNLGTVNTRFSVDAVVSLVGLVKASRLSVPT